MAYYVVWLDRAHAKVYSMGQDHKSLSLKWSKPDHHTHRHDAKDDVSQAFYHEVAKSIGDAIEVLVVGPGQAKSQFKHHLEQHDAPLAKKVVAYEAADHPTEGQLLDHARRFFRDPLHAAP